MTALDFTRIPTLEPIVRAVEERVGISAVQRCFKAQDVPFDVITRPDAVLSLRDFFGLFEQFARACGDKAFGLAAGEAIDPTRFGILVEYAMQAPSLAVAIMRLHRSLPLHQGGTSMVLTTSGDQAVWSYKVNQPFSIGRHHHAVQAVFQMRQFIFDYLEYRPILHEVGLEAEEYGLGAIIEEAFDTPVLLSQRNNYVVFERNLLSRGRPADKTYANPVTFRDLIHYVRSTPPLTLSEKVAATLRMFLESGQASIEPVAAHLAIGVRTLQRRLATEGRTFHDILEHVRRSRAEELILETKLPMIQIADMLGYSDPAHFSRAYKRWHGHAPNQFRSFGRTRNDVVLKEGIGIRVKDAA